MTLSEVRTSRKELFSKVGWMSVKQLIYYHTALCTYRIRKSKEPEYLCAIIDRNNRANKIIVPNFTLTLAMKSFCFRGSNDWNKLPETVRSCEKLGRFKQQLRLWVLQNVQQLDD